MTYGCHNRLPFKSSFPVMIGGRSLHSRGFHERVQLMDHIPFRMAPDCQYTKTELGRTDERCAGCKWREPDAVS
jgi:hypothetical protein